MGRDEIENWVDSMNYNIPYFKVFKGFFDYPNREDYIKFNNQSYCKQSNSLIFENENQDFFKFQSNINECKSAFVLIKKSIDIDGENT
jgi:hypothetical protein